MTDAVYLRDLDGTGSMHVCSQEDPDAREYLPADARPVTVAEAAKVLMPDIERIVKATEPHFVSHEDVEDTIYGMKIRMIVALRALSHEGGE